MKKIIIGIILGISFTVLIGAGLIDYVVSKKTAEVEMYQNICVFTDCKPVSDYEYLGTVSGRMSLSGQYEPVRDGLIKNAKKQYPHANGVILHLKDGGVDKADVIKFK